MVASRVAIHGARFVAFTCDEVTVLDNQSWILSMVIVFKIGVVSQFFF
jgi:hypothetical protein